MDTISLDREAIDRASAEHELIAVWMLAASLKKSQRRWKPLTDTGTWNTRTCVRPFCSTCGLLR